MKTVEDNVKCGEVIYLTIKFYLKNANFSANFVPMVGILSKYVVPRAGAFE